MRKIWIFVSVVVLLSVFSLFIFNYKYPFITKKVGRWSVGFQNTANVFPSPKLDPNQLITYSRLDSILKSEDNYIADPFYLKKDGIYYLFVELKGKENADIALFTSKDGITYSYKSIILDEPFHLSYPQVFKYEDDFYMLPEKAMTQIMFCYTNLWTFLIIG